MVYNGEEEGDYGTTELYLAPGTYGFYADPTCMMFLGGGEILDPPCSLTGGVIVNTPTIPLNCKTGSITVVGANDNRTCDQGFFTLALFKNGQSTPAMDGSNTYVKQFTGNDETHTFTGLDTGAYTVQMVSGDCNADLGGGIISLQSISLVGTISATPTVPHGCHTCGSVSISHATDNTPCGDFTLMLFRNGTSLYSAMDPSNTYVKHFSGSDESYTFTSLDSGHYVVKMISGNYTAEIGTGAVLYEPCNLTGEVDVTPSVLNGCKTGSVFITHANDNNYASPFKLNLYGPGISVTAMNPGGAGQKSFYGSDESYTFTGLPAGDYSVQMISAGCTTYIAQKAIALDCQLTLNTFPPTGTGNADYQVTNNGCSSYTVYLIDSAGSVVVTNVPHPFNLPGSGPYTLKVDAGNGCFQSTTLELSPYYADSDQDGFGNNSNSIISCFIPSGYVTDHTDCNDNLVTYPDLDGDGFGGGSFASCGIADHSDCDDANAFIHPGASDICDNIDDNCNGVVDENAIVATITPAITQTICDGSSVTLTANTGSGISYQWKRGTKNLAGATNQTYTTKKAGNYSVYESNGFNCSSASSAVKVNVNPSPDAVINAGNLNLCAGTVMLTANSGSGYLYQWMKGDNLISGASSISYTATKKGTYKVIITNAYGCSKTSKGVKVINSCKEETFDSELLALDLYPNPGEGFFTLEITLPSQQQLSLHLFNVIGSEVFSSDEGIAYGNLTRQLNLSYLPAGTYFLNIIHDGDREIRKVVIVH